MTNGEKLNQVFGLPKEANKNVCMRNFDKTNIECVGVCSDCRYSSINWSKREYKEPKVKEEKKVKMFYTFEEAVSYVKENNISAKNFVSLNKLSVCTFTVIRGCWELTYTENIYTPAEN